MSIGEEIRRIRKELGLTQKELAAKIGLATGTIQQYELNKRSPSLNQIIKIADVLDIPILEFFPSANNELTRYIYEQGFCESQDELRDLGYCFSKSENEIVIKFKKLNDEGQQKVVEYADDLTKIPQYQRKPQEGDENAVDKEKDD